MLESKSTAIPTGEAEGTLAAGGMGRMRSMRRVGCVLSDNCAVRLFSHNKPEKILTSLKLSICYELCRTQSLGSACAGIVVDDRCFCFRTLHRHTRKRCQRCTY